MVRTSFNHLLDVFRFDVQWHGANETTVRWRGARSEPDGTRTAHANVEFLQFLRVLKVLSIESFYFDSFIQNKFSWKIQVF